jgi:ABC-type transporter Mla subunit MlaD
MEREQLKQTLKSLHRELESQNAVDTELTELLGTLDQDIHHLISQAPASPQTASAIQAAESLAARFAANHPRAEAIVQEIVALLGRMGV